MTAVDRPPAADDRRPARRRRLAILLAAAAAATASQAFGRFTYSLLFTDVRDDLGLSNSRAGTLGSANLAAYLTGTLLVSVLVGRLGLSRTTRGGLVGVTAGLLLLGWAPGFGVAVLGLVLTGAFAAGVWITVPAIATAQVAATRRGAAIGVVGGMMGIGIVGASLLDATLDTDQWRFVYRAEAVIAVLTLVAALKLFRDDGPPVAGPSGFSVIRTIAGWPRLLVTYGLFGTAMTLMVTFMVAVLREDAGYSSAQASLAFSYFGVGTVLGGPLFGPLADRLGRRAALVCAFGVMATTALVLASGARPWATIAATCFGTAFTGVPTTIAAVMSDAVDRRSFGAAYGVATLAFGVGLTIGPQLGGAIGDRVDSFRPVFVLAAGIATVAALLVLRPIGAEARQPSAEALTPPT